MFDLISAEYGWDDDTILDLTLARFRQISATLAQRLYVERRRQENLLEWQTKALAFQLTGLARSKKGAKAMASAAERLQIRPAVKAESRSTSQEGWTPDTPVDPNDPRFARQSFEALGFLMQGITQER